MEEECALTPSSGLRLRVLVLGGSTEASALATALATRHDIDATLSLAGRVREPAPQPLPTRVGGFGGVEGLATYLRAERIALLVDATHPFAATMSANARAAARLAGVPLLDAGRGGWTPKPDDRWTEVATMAEAAVALGAAPRRVFLTVGRLQLAAFRAAPQHHYLVRSIDPVSPEHGLADASFFVARGPFEIDGEVALMRRHGIAVLVTKNSGGTASFGKIEAARRLDLPVVLVRPPDGSGARLGVEGVLAEIERSTRQPSPRDAATETAKG